MWHPYSVFVTLTYDGEYLPVNEYGLGTLYPYDLTKFLKRFRNSNGSFRYYACGEYGTKENSERPHYHLVIFGISIAWEKAISDAWLDPETRQPMGFTSVSELNSSRSAYVAQYTVKKMTGQNAKGLHGRYPEFARSSNRPGIGAPALPWLRDIQLSRHGAYAMQKHGDVFTCIRIDGKIWPLGHYMRKKLREECGVPQNAPERAAMFGKVYEPDEEEWAIRLPENYCPEMDLLDAPTARRSIEEAQKKIIELPEIHRKADHAKRRRKRRQLPTEKV